jgi:pyruvate/2-oxoglutarate/acetoin dehydrogenase E1 component
MGVILRYMSYHDLIKKSMSILASNNRCIFLGQSIIYPGNLIFKTLDHIPNLKKIELPVFEDTQMGMSIGLALNGFLPVTTYPRFDFLLLAFNQMINHLDKFPIITEGQFVPKVIIRVLVGAKKPLDSGEQHTQNYVKQVTQMLKTIEVYDLKKKNDILRSYKKAIKSKYSSLMVEYSDKF